MNLQCLRNDAQSRQHKISLSHSTSSTGCCQTAAGNFLPRVTCGERLHKSRGQAKCPWLNHCYTNIWVCTGSDLSLQVWIWIHLAGALCLLAQEERWVCVCVGGRGGGGAVPISGKPQEAWMGLSWGPSSWFWGPSEQLDLGSLLSLLVLNLWSCQAEQRLWEEEPELLVEFRSSQDRGW